MKRSFIPVITFLGFVAVLSACGPTTTNTPASPTPAETVALSPDTTVTPSPTPTTSP